MDLQTAGAGMAQDYQSLSPVSSTQTYLLGICSLLVLDLNTGNNLMRKIYKTLFLMKILILIEERVADGH